MRPRVLRRLNIRRARSRYVLFPVSTLPPPSIKSTPSARLQGVFHRTPRSLRHTHSSTILSLRVVLPLVSAELRAMYFLCPVQLPTSLPRTPR
ncbi:hypothetical protein DFH09DRAFT_1204506, partial [Mycena vulgaris]